MIPRSLKDQPRDHVMILAQEFVSDKPARIISTRIYKWLTTAWAQDREESRKPKTSQESLPTYLLLSMSTEGKKGKRKKLQEQAILAYALLKLTIWRYSNKCTTVICDTSLHRHFDIVQTYHTRIWETHLLVLVALAAVYSKAVQTLKPDLNSLKHYYTAK